MSEKDAAFLEIDLYLNLILDIFDKNNYISKEIVTELVEKLRFYMKEYVILHENMGKMNKAINYVGKNWTFTVKN